MVNLNEYRDYFGQICSGLGIDKIVMVVQEEHLRKRLPGQAGTILAVVYPSGTGTGEPDNIADTNTCLLFVLQNNNKTESDPEKEFDNYATLQKIAIHIKQRLIDDSDNNYPLFRELDHESFQIDPEWNIAGSYIGYSISFNFNY